VQNLLHVQHDLHLVCLGPVPLGHDLRHLVPRRPVCQLGCLPPCLQHLQRRLLCLYRLGQYPVLCLRLGQLPFGHDLRHHLPHDLFWQLVNKHLPVLLGQLRHLLLGFLHRLLDLLLGRVPLQQRSVRDHVPHWYLHLGNDLRGLQQQLRIVLYSGRHLHILLDLARQLPLQLCVLRDLPLGNLRQRRGLLCLRHRLHHLHLPHGLHRLRVRHPVPLPGCLLRELPLGHVCLLDHGLLSLQLQLRHVLWIGQHVRDLPQRPGPLSVGNLCCLVPRWILRPVGIDRVQRLLVHLRHLLGIGLDVHVLPRL